VKQVSKSAITARVWLEKKTVYFVEMSRPVCGHGTFSCGLMEVLLFAVFSTYFCCEQTDSENEKRKAYFLAHAPHIEDVSVVPSGLPRT